MKIEQPFGCSILFFIYLLLFIVSSNILRRGHYLAI